MKYILFILGLFAITHQVFPQSVIYKTNGEAVSVYNLNVSGKNLSYNLPGDAEDIKRLMSTTIVDSIKHEDGSTDVFIKSAIPDIISNDEKQSFNRFLVGVDLAAITFYDNLKFSFEYLLGKGSIGLYAAHAINTNPQDLLYWDDSYDNYFYGNIMNVLHWNSRVGINAYVFPPGSFRLSTGLHWTHGRFMDERNISLNEPPWTITTTKTKRPFSGLILSPGFNWQFTSYLRLTLAVDIGLYNNPKIAGNTQLRSEIQLNF